MSESFGNQCIWIVGASSGIGRALAEALVREGSFVFVTARDETKLQQLQQLYPSRIGILSGDITDADSLSHIRRSLYERTDVLDVLIQCAGICEYDDGPKLDLAMYRRVFEVNFFAAIACAQIALPLLKASKGRIVGVSSLASVLPFPRAEAYGASKCALEYCLESLKVDLRDSAVSVTIVRPGFVDTPLTQNNDFSMPFLIDAEQAARKVVAGLKQGRAYINFPWQMSFSLRLLANFRALWLRFIAPRLRKAAEF